MKKEISRKFCVAPMMGYTTPYARKLYRILSNNSFLFSEMIATKSLIYSKSRENIIDNDFNNPVALQVGGSEIEDLSKASKIPGVSLAAAVMGVSVRPGEIELALIPFSPNSCAIHLII